MVVWPGQAPRERPRFGVALGNSAEGFYHHLGFAPGTVQYTLAIPPSPVSVLQDGHDHCAH
jgi:hypothetical protein